MTVGLIGKRRPWGDLVEIPLDSVGKGLNSFINLTIAGEVDLPQAPVIWTEDTVVGDDLSYDDETGIVQINNDGIYSLWGYFNLGSIDSPDGRLNLTCHKSPDFSGEASYYEGLPPISEPVISEGAKVYHYALPAMWYKAGGGWYFSFQRQSDTIGDIRLYPSSALTVSRIL